MIELRENQKDPVRLGVEFFRKVKPVPSLIVAPTAFGKSIVISSIAHELGEKILILQPSKELLEQNYAKLIKLGGSASIYSASMGVKEIGDITYATIGSIKDVGYKFKSLGITKMIIDEADRFPRSSDSMLGKFLKSSGINHVLGLTATPLKLQTLSDFFTGERYSMLRMLTTRNKFGTFFRDIIHVCQIQEMVRLGFWAKLKYEVYDFDSGDLVYNSTGAEFTDESLQEAYEDQEIEEKIIRAVENNPDRKSILVFVPSIEKAHELSSKIPDSKVVTGNTNKEERKEILDEFRSLRTRVVINVNVLSVGFDHPELDCIIAGRPTASLSWWYQAVGRITRIHPNKTDGLIIDFSGNTTKFGRIEELVFVNENGIWKLFGENKKQLTEVKMASESPKKEVPKSKFTLPFGVHKGKYLHQVPASYIYWLAREYTFKHDQKELKDEVTRLRKLLKAEKKYV